MDSAPTRTSSSTAAWAGLLVALPLLYGLSMGPCAYLFQKFPRTQTMRKAMQAFYQPMIWLHDHTALKAPLEEYVGWWDRLGRKS